MRGLRAAAALSAPLLLAAATAAHAFTLAEIESDIGLTADQRAQLESGQVVSRTVSSANERELAVGLVVRIPSPPEQLAKQLVDGLTLRKNPDVLGRGAIKTGDVGDFAGVKLANAAAAQAYLAAKPGSALNLSREEIAAFQALARDAAAKADPKSAVEGLIRQQLQARYRSYAAQGLAGIAPYARSSGEAQPADDLRAALSASKLFAKYAPAMRQFLLDYPKQPPAGLQERQQWLLYNAHGARAIILADYLAMPDGPGWSAAVRQYYVSTNYNAEQNQVLLVPAADGTTVAIALSRVSTEQVAGMGGSMKRGIGAKLMAGTLTDLAQSVRGAAGKK